MAETEKLEFCGKQVKRLASKAFFPTTKEGKEELAYTLDSFTKSTAHAERVINAAVLSKFGADGKLEDRCPGPADLAELCGRIAPSVAQEASPNCEFCAGNGFEDTGAGYGRCRCGGSPMSNKSRIEWSRKNFEGERFEAESQVKRLG